MQITNNNLFNTYDINISRIMGLADFAFQKN